MNKTKVTFALISGFCFFCSLPLEAAWFIGIGDLAGNGSGADGISGDGNVVVGSSVNSSYEYEAFRWTEASGMVGLGYLPVVGTSTEGAATSFDGSVVVGQAFTPSSSLAFRWTDATGMVSLGLIDSGGTASVAAGVSSDGNVVVGGGDSTASNTFGEGEEAFRWTEATGMVGLGDLAGGIFSSNAEGVSGDGSVVVGDSKSTSGREAFRWTQASGMIGLGDLPGGIFDSVATAASMDGSIIVGDSESALGTEMFRWTEVTGMVGLGNMGGTLLFSEARDVSADGRLIIGHGETALTSLALIWDETNGLRDIQQMLLAAGVDLDGWQLQGATGISDDGTIISGYGLNPDGNGEAWIASLGDDTDRDGVSDTSDNCISVANANQLDTDSDGYGNACDADLDNSGGVVNFADLAAFKSAFGTSDPDADFDGSGGVVNFADLAIFKQLFGKLPGPSCCGTLSP